MSEKAWKRWMFAACLLFFMIAAACVSAQAPTQPMKFNHAEDTVYVGVADGKVFAYFKHDRTTDYTLRIGYTSGAFEDLKGEIKGVLRVYPLEADVRHRLKTTPFDVVFFDGKEKRYVCTEIKTKNYFITNLPTP